MSQADELIATVKAARAQVEADRLVRTAARTLLAQATKVQDDHAVELRKAERALLEFIGINPYDHE